MIIICFRDNENTAISNWKLKIGNSKIPIAGDFWLINFFIVTGSLVSRFSKETVPT